MRKHCIVWDYEDFGDHVTKPEMEEELWIARHDYSKERDDVLSFDKGTRFKVMSRSNAEWWAVKNVDTQEVGYVPSSYLEVSSFPHARRNYSTEQSSDACSIRNIILVVWLSVLQRVRFSFACMASSCGQCAA